MEFSINQRIKELIEYKKLSQDQFAFELGIKKQQVSNWVKFVEKVPEKHLITVIKKYPDINARWLFLGEGSMVEGEDSKIEGNIQDQKSDYRKACEEKDLTIKCLSDHINTLKETIASKQQVIDLMKGSPPKNGYARSG